MVVHGRADNLLDKCLKLGGANCDEDSALPLLLHHA